MLAELGLTAGGSVDLTLADGQLILAPVKRPNRAGWAEGAAAVAAAGDDQPVWPDFGNDGDEALVW